MVKQNKGVLRIGTSGIVVPGPRESFPVQFQDKSRLNYYSSLFNTLEVNSTFHKLPMRSTLEKWSLDVPEGFQFTIKLWREITHVKGLHIDPGNIDTFFSRAEAIGNKKGSLLVQFPGSITVDYSKKVEKIFERIDELDRENKWQKAIEFRSVTWYVSETCELLNKYNASMVLHDMPKSKNEFLNEAEKFIYLRFHGPKGDYRGSYSDEYLRAQAEKIGNVLNNGKDVYVYFNNTMGDALQNALSLKNMLKT